MYDHSSANGPFISFAHVSFGDIFFLLLIYRSSFRKSSSFISVMHIANIYLHFYILLTIFFSFLIWPNLPSSRLLFVVFSDFFHDFLFLCFLQFKYGMTRFLLCFSCLSCMVFSELAGSVVLMSIIINSGKFLAIVTSNILSVS